MLNVMASLCVYNHKKMDGFTLFVCLFVYDFSAYQACILDL